MLLKPLRPNPPSPGASQSLEKLEDDEVRGEWRCLGPIAASTERTEGVVR